jgi:hypothetical protein
MEAVCDDLPKADWLSELCRRSPGARSMFSARERVRKSAAAIAPPVDENRNSHGDGGSIAETLSGDARRSGSFGECHPIRMCANDGADGTRSGRPAWRWCLQGPPSRARRRIVRMAADAHRRGFLRSAFPVGGAGYRPGRIGLEMEKQG